MNRRHVLQSLGAMLLAGALPVGPACAQTAQLETIRMNIPGPHLLPYIPIELIPLLGIDTALGAQLAIRYMPSGVQALEDVVAGNADFAGVGFSVMPSFVKKGKPALAIATLSSGTPPYAVLVRNDLAREVRSISDLRGRSIGIPLGSATTKTYLQMLMELWLRSYGVKPNQVRWVPTNMNYNGMYGALASASVDAVFCEEPLSGTLVRKQIGTQLASLSDPKNPARIVGRQHLRAVLATRPALAHEHYRKVEVMLAMLQRVMAWINRTPPAQVVEKLGIEDSELSGDIVSAMTRIKNLYSRDGQFAPEEIQSTADFLKAAAVPLPDGFSIESIILQPGARRP